MKDHEKAYTALREAFYGHRWQTQPPPIGTPFVLHGSPNIVLMAAVARYLDGRGSDEAKMLEYLEARIDYELADDFMFNEPLSPIYTGWHVAPWAAAWKAAQKYGHLSLAEKIYRWLFAWAYYAALMAEPHEPQPGMEGIMKGPLVLQPGMRSTIKRAETDPMRSRMLAILAGFDPYEWRKNRDGVLDWMAKPWQWPAEMLKDSGFFLWPQDETAIREVLFEREEIVPASLPRFRTKLHVRRFSTGGWQAWFEENVNGNTPPCLGVQWDGKVRVLQPHGNARRFSGRGECIAVSETKIVASGWDKNGKFIASEGAEVSAIRSYWKGTY